MIKWIDAGDIKNWVSGKQRHCQQTLPELVRRLISAHTANAVEEFDFPSGDSIATGGWDGRLRTPVVSPFFPNGASGWEISAEKSSAKKADLANWWTTKRQELDEEMADKGMAQSGIRNVKEEMLRRKYRDEFIQLDAQSKHLQKIKKYKWIFSK